MKSNAQIQIILLKSLNDAGMVSEFTKDLSISQAERLINSTPDIEKIELFKVMDPNLQINYFTQKLHPIYQIDVIRKLPPYQSIRILQAISHETAIHLLPKACDEPEMIRIFRALNIQTKYLTIQNLMSTTKLPVLKQMVSSITPEEIFVANQQYPTFGYALNCMIQTIQAINIQ